MEIREIEYMRRVNLGSYEHEEIAAKAVLAEGEDFRVATKELRNAVLVELGIMKETAKEEVKKPTPAKKETKAPDKKAAPKKETKKKAPAKKTAAKKKANIKYDRDIDEHKEELGQIFEEILGDWKSDKEVLKKCAGVSREVVGMDFMDADGKVLEEFKETVAVALEDVEGDL